MLTFSSLPLTVGAITDEKALTNTFGPESADLIELRLDALGAGQNVIEFAKRHSKSIPLLITARDPSEGGLNSLSHEERASLLQSLLPFAAAIDVEFANADSFSSLLTEAKSQDIKIVLSNHDFIGFDHMTTIDTIARAQASGADVAKAAVTVKDPVDLTLFESLLADMSGSPFSLMGMGPYGPVSRILAAQHGSLLNYGFLGAEPTAPGQWPAPLLKQVLAATPPITVAP
ncbi:MAG: type I 3-dehydroquinate dehydratase [Roseibacillus sp.]